MKKLYLFLTSFFIGIIFFVFVPHDSLIIKDQSVGTSIYVDKISLTESGFIVFTQEGVLIAASDLFLPGVYTDLNVEPIYTPGRLVPGKFEATLYQDNGDAFFDITIDSPKKFFGRESIATFRLLSGTKLKDELLKILEDCSNDSQISLDFGCFREKTKILVSKENLAEILNSLEEIFANRATPITYGARSCHSVGHVIGELSIQNKIGLPDVNSSCGVRCDYGCLHGAFSESLLGSDDFIKEATGFCGKYNQKEPAKDYEACSHVIGHSLTEYFKGDTSEALKLCETFDRSGTRECLRGSFMETFMGSPDNPQRKFDDPSQLLKYCSEVETKYKTECLGYIGFYSYSLYGEDTAIDFCTRVPSIYQSDCSYSLGSVSYFYYRDNPAGIISLCKKTKYYESCIKGALEVFAGDKLYIEKGRQLCTLSEKSFGEECNQELCKRIKWAYGSTSSCEPNSLR